MFRKSLAVAVILLFIGLSVIPATATPLDNDVELIIRGGFGVHFIVKKEAGSPKVLANFTVYGRGIIFEHRFHNSTGNFSCSEFVEEAEFWYIINPVFLPITATLEVNGKKLTRRGVNTMYVVIFFPLH